MQKRSRIFLTTALLGALLLSSFKRESVPVLPTDCRTVLNQMLDSMREVGSMRFYLKITERAEGKYYHYESKGKFNRSPRKIYVFMRGPELLWKEGWNSGKALVNPGGFPYINLNLDPMGSLIRDKQHHTIFEMGMDYFADVLGGSIKKNEKDFDKYFRLVGSTTWNNRPCHLVIMEFPGYAYENYKVKKGQNILKIARELNVSEFMVLEINSEKVKDYYDVEEGQIIKVPNAYAKKTTLMIDKDLMLPINSIIYDEKGIFESYEYHEISVNVKFKEDEFTKDFEGYGF